MLEPVSCFAFLDSPTREEERKKKSTGLEKAMNCWSLMYSSKQCNRNDEIRSYDLTAQTMKGALSSRVGQDSAPAPTAAEGVVHGWMLGAPEKSIYESLGVGAGVNYNCFHNTPKKCFYQ